MEASVKSSSYIIIQISIRASTLVLSSSTRLVLILLYSVQGRKGGGEAAGGVSAGPSSLRRSA